MQRFMESLQQIFDRAEDYLRHVVSGFRLREPDIHYENVSAQEEYTDEAMKALEEWHAAENYFNCIDDPDLVEYALYELEAARHKYEYLLRKLRSGDASWERGSTLRQ